MMNHESRDLDSVIDEVAQAMTRAELRRDLRPAIAERLEARPPSWLSGWGVAAAGAAAALVMLVAMMMRPGESPQPPRVADSGSPRPTVASAPARAGDASASAPTVIAVRAVRPPTRRAVGRQTIAPATPGVVEIRPLSVVPLEEEDVEADAQALSGGLVIVSIDVEPVRISQLELVE